MSLSSSFFRGAAGLSVASLIACRWAFDVPQTSAPAFDSAATMATELPPVGWSARMAPTRAEILALASLRDRARVRRSSSAALREAERAACVGLTDEELDVSPFFHRRDIADVLPLRDTAAGEPGPLDGVVIVFRPVEGLTAARLEALVTCHVARDRALGDAAPELAWCPLDVPALVARTAVGERGLEVLLRSPRAPSAAEAYMRATALLEPRSAEAQ